MCVSHGFFNLTNDLSRPNQSPSAILKARPQVICNFLTLVLVSRLTIPCASLHTAVISHYLVNIFVEPGTVKLELHSWDLSDHSPSKTHASIDVLYKTLHQMPSWREKAGLILITPLFPLPIGYRRDTLEKFSLDQWKKGLNGFSNLILSFFIHPVNTYIRRHTSTNSARLQLLAASFKESIILSITSLEHSVPSIRVLTCRLTFQ